MKEYYSSLFKGNVHVTTPFSTSHPAIDLGNYKTRNPIYSPNFAGNGKVTKQTDSYKYNGITYSNTLTQWIAYDTGFETCTVHGSTKDRILKVGDKVEIGQLVYRTGNTGYSFGDHLHFQLKKGGALIDPAPYVLNDLNFKPDDMLNIKDRVEIKADTWMRKGPGIEYEDSKYLVKKGSVGTVVGGPRNVDGYEWWDINFKKCPEVSKFNQGWMANVNGDRFVVTSKAQTCVDGSDGVVVPPEPVDSCKDLREENIKLKNDLKEVVAVNDHLNSEINVLTQEVLLLQDELDNSISQQAKEEETDVLLAIVLKRVQYEKSKL